MLSELEMTHFEMLEKLYKLDVSFLKYNWLLQITDSAMELKRVSNVLIFSYFKISTNIFIIQTAHLFHVNTKMFRDLKIEYTMN